MASQLQHDILYETLSTVLKDTKIVCEKIYFSMKKDPKPEDYVVFLRKIARKSHFRLRKQKLLGDWWTTDNGPLLGFYRGEPCALLPKEGGYQLISLAYGVDRLIHHDHHAELKDLEGDAFYFYPGFSGKMKNILGIVQLALPVVKRDFSYLVVTLIMVTAAQMIFSIGAGVLIQEAVAYTDMVMFKQIFLALVLIGVSSIFVYLVQMFVTIRLSFKLELNMAPPIFDRLLRLPMKFFFKHTAADTQMRMNAAKTLQSYFNYTVLLSFLEGIFSIFSLFILAYFSTFMAMISLGFAIIVGVVVMFLNRGLLRMQYQQMPYSNKLYHLVIQMIHGLEKIKSTASESKIFRQWFAIFGEKITLQQRELHFAQRLIVVNKMVEIVGSATLLIFIVTQDSGISIMDFMIINSAFMYFWYGMLSVFQASSQLLEIFPYVEQVAPILKTTTEDEQVKNSPGVLKGAIELKNINFRYQRDQGPVLNRISLKVNPGECVAIVGESGSGKSTLLKILLGFLKPDEGHVAYDNVDLQHLDMFEVRSQIGTIMQGAKLLPGTIFDNIAVGKSDFTREAALYIIRSLGFEAMIQKLPMGLDTPVDASVNSFSGGEMQQIQLASLVARGPSIIFLDEATSALDNQIQEKAQIFLRSYKNTQFIIAHRLSTIRYADRIFVMRNGTIVEEGHFEELIKKGGYFTSLVEAKKF